MYSHYRNIKGGEIHERRKCHVKWLAGREISTILLQRNPSFVEMLDEVHFCCRTVCWKVTKYDVDILWLTVSVYELSERPSYIVLYGIWALLKIRVLTPETFSRILSGLWKISKLQVDRRKCRRLSSTDDRHQFITLFVHLCVQNDGREAARRAGSSVTAESCTEFWCWRVIRRSAMLCGA